MPIPKEKRATYEDLLQVPDILIAELLDGELIVSPRPGAPHTRVASMMGGDLTGSFDRPPGEGGPGGWIILDEPELHLGEQVVVPDLAGWRRERMPEVPNVAAFTLVPDWVCEVISPKSARIDRVRKMSLYAEYRVGYYWLIDPIVRTVEVYRLDAGHWIVRSTHTGDEPMRAEPFDAIELDPRRWWINL